MADKSSTLKLKVNLDCKCCYKKIHKILCKIQVEESITTISYDDKKDIVTISGPFCPQKLKQKLRCKAGKLIIDITIVLPVEKPPPPPPAPAPAKPLDVNVNVKFDPAIQVCCPSKPSSCGGNCCCSSSSCGGGCYCSKPSSCGGSSCYCGITPCRGSYPPSYGLPSLQISIEDTQPSCSMM